MSNEKVPKKVDFILIFCVFFMILKKGLVF